MYGGFKQYNLLTYNFGVRGCCVVVKAGANFKSSEKFDILSTINIQSDAIWTMAIGWLMDKILKKL